MTFFLLTICINAGIYFLATRNVVNDIERDMRSKLMRVGYVVLFLVFIYKVVMNMLLDTYLIGTYSDVVIGLLMWGYLDIVFIVVEGKDSISRIYKSFRKVYVYFNLFRVSVYFFFLLVFGIGFPIAFPPENIHRTKDLVVFNRFHFNGIDVGYYSYGLINAKVNVFKRVGLIFKKKILTIEQNESEVSNSYVKFFSPDSVLIQKLHVYVYKEGDSYYLHERFKKTIKLN